MKKYLKQLIKRFFKRQSTRQSLECYCKEQPWAPSCRIYEE